MGKPESRRFSKPPAEPQGELRPLRPGEPPAPAPSPSPAPTGKTTRKIPRTTRRVADDDGAGGGAAQAAAQAAATEAKSQNQMLLIGGVGGGVLLLLIIIAVAASGGSSGRAAETSSAQQRSKRKVAEAPPPPPRESPREYNYVRNTGSIVFVCGGSDKHQDREIVLSTCLKCSTKNQFAVEAGAGYLCTSCKTVYDNAAIKCDQCDRQPRVTHLKKVASYQQ